MIEKKLEGDSRWELIMMNITVLDTQTVQEKNQVYILDFRMVSLF